ncbi:WD40 repeat-like protein [Gloeophyllum trabeum ATCC 11539]|uniref:WD40 repeat-like protein n=1 Tax=Gloeophyllum trabeum (strain ATCC 11539 / FP-39264 / Madison 617) TaxID=670483 RepID=S7Q824_GLOTA|nr:WD40 repeat-like protein [Gloeophyllum trabeum ATCC 11539]EPQ56136.1 WD40 repeat-like protein [Gloeophyllum trabeum ATCC 11539]
MSSNMKRTSRHTDVRPTKKQKTAAHALRTDTKKNKKRAGTQSPAKSELPPTKTSVKGKEKAINTSKGFLKDRPLSSVFVLVAGSYEKLLYGLEGSSHFDESEGALKYELKPIFAFPAHVSCVKAVSISPEGGKWLATGSADEIIKVWDLRRRKEIGGLMHHEGSITQLTFPSRSHLMSASEDGMLSLFHTRDWAVLRTLKGHKGRVNSFAAHPSGKVALSVGKDRTLRMWDLMRGKGSASVKLGKEGEIVRWSSDGTMFIVQVQNTIDVYATDMSLLCSITHPSRVQDVKFCKIPVQGDEEREFLLVGAEDKKVSLYDIASASDKQIPAIVAEMVGHANRVKAVDTIRISLPPSSGRRTTTIAGTVSSDGKVLVYDLQSSLSQASLNRDNVTVIQPVAEYDTKGTRLTCMALGEGDIKSVPDIGKRSRCEEEGSEAEEQVSDEEEEWAPQEEMEEEEEEGSASEVEED